MNTIKLYLRLIRCEQWAKNVFLLAPLIFSKHLFEAEYVLEALQAFGAFSFASSFVYIINDIIDKEEDALHPIKKNRPIASGAVRPVEALMLAVFIFILAVGFSITLTTTVKIIIGLYMLVNIFYSYYLKSVVLVDVFIIATGFMLRVLAGAYVINVVISHWLVLCTLFLSLFLAISKRRSELVLTSHGKGCEKHARIVLQFYTVDFLDQLITIAAAGVAISYALYTVAERTIAVFKTENLIFTTVFVLFGVFRYMYLIRNNNIEDNPTHIILTDRPLLFTIGAWFIVCIIIIYFNDIVSAGKP
ncbi:MAG: decaprenyl-phosphate phosphoribosyltransferase [Bacteroidetes bacterium]|nr:decaprenyl-phosphate phosphoribosyltransferase [Bacteroidota bacterium]